MSSCFPGVVLDSFRLVALHPWLNKSAAPPLNAEGAGSQHFVAGATSVRIATKTVARVVLARRYLEDHLAANSNAKLRGLVALNKCNRLTGFSSIATRRSFGVGQVGRSSWPGLRSTLRLQKYSRSMLLAGKLGEILELLASSLPAGRLTGWIQAIGVYVMSLDKNIDSQQYKQTLKSVFPTQFEPGSLADRLLIQGREEGRLAGTIQCDHFIGPVRSN